MLASEKLAREAPSTSVLIFRLASEWLALDTSTLVEIAEWRTPHRIPHRAGLVSGLVNIRGQLQLCVSLHRLLGIPEPEGRVAGSAGARLVVARGGQRTWVFGAEEVLGVHRVAVDTLSGVPLTVAEAERRFTRGLFELEKRWVGYLESGALFAALEGLG